MYSEGDSHCHHTSSYNLLQCRENVSSRFLVLTVKEQGEFWSAAWTSMSKLPSSPRPVSGVPESPLAKTEFEPRLCQELAEGQLLKLS